MMPLAKFTRGSAWPVYLLSSKSLRTRGRRPPPFLFAPSPRLPSAHDLPAPAHDPYMQRKQKLVLVSRSDQRSRVATSAFTDSGTPPTPHLYSCPDRSTPPTPVTMPSLFTLTITLYRDPSSCFTTPYPPRIHPCRPHHRVSASPDRPSPPYHTPTAEDTTSSPPALPFPSHNAATPNHCHLPAFPVFPCL
ncbi:extensin-like [Penaeus monodon]|uniref:extensin-like n=1 Tax=Penaeus monodon TaxID=6687 RepID=UPI0018A6DBA2|nr:extensin-like [Penaeus monodon]